MKTKITIRPVAALALLAAAVGAQAQIQRISTALDGTQSNHDSYEASLSDDGSVIAFRSSASNLLAGDVNDLPDVFLRDLSAGTIEQVNVDDMGNVLDFSNLYRGSYAPSVSDDGQRVVFSGYPDYAQGVLRDRLANTTLEVLRISFTSNNTDRQARQQSRISGNGQFVVFHSRAAFQNSEPVSARPANTGTVAMHSIFLYDAVTDPTPMAERLSRPDFTGDTSCIADTGLECPEGNADSFDSLKDMASTIDAGKLAALAE